MDSETGPNHADRRPPTWSGFVIVVSTGIVALVGTALVAVYSHRGFDVTDEGYFLNLIARPSDFGSSTSAGMFQYVWHPVYVLTGGSVTGLRVINAAVTVAVTFALAWTLSGRAVVKLLTRDPAATGRIELSVRFMMSTAAAVASLAVFQSWRLTPNGMSLTYQAIALTMWCCLLVLSRSGFLRDLAFAGIAAGLWLCFLAKPTSAALLGLLVLLFLLAPSRRSWRTFAILAVGLVVVAGASLVAMGLTPVAFTDYFGDSLTLRRTMGGPGLIGRPIPDSLALGSDLQSVALLGSFALVVVCAVLLHHLRPAFGRTVAVLSVVGAATVSVVLLVAIDDIGMPGPGLGPVYWLALPAALLVLVVLGVGRLHRTMSGNGLALLALFFVLPLCAAIGTDNNGWQTFNRVAAFWAVAGIVVAVTVDQSRRRAMLPFFAVASVFAVLTLALSIVNPHRQESLLKAHTLASVGPEGVVLRVDPKTAGHLAQLRSVIGPTPGGLRRGVVDLTGESPGLIYASDARALGQARIVGSDQGGADIAEFALEETRCVDLERAAILVAPEGRRQIDTAVLSTVGLDLDRDFALADTVPSGPGLLEVFLPKPSIHDPINCRV